METQSHTPEQEAGTDADIGTSTGARADGEPSGNGTSGNGVAPLSRDDFIARAKAYRAKPTVERVPLPWLGENECAYVRGMASFERDEFEASLVERSQDGTERITARNIRAKFLVRTLCNVDGVRLFADQEDGLISALDAKTADALYDKARGLSGLTEADIKEMAKNSERARSAATSSSSDLKS